VFWGRRIQWVCALLVLCLAMGAAVARPALAAADQSSAVIDEIRIEGTQRIEPETVRSYMRINPGDPFDPIRLDKSLKNIFSTGLFADVTLRREGNALIVTVVENPIINRIAFEGNDELDDEAKDMPIARKRIDDADLNLVISNSFGFGGTNATLALRKFTD